MSSKGPSKSERIAIFAGSFDPFTTGHEQIVEQALLIFDKIIIAVGQSLSKVALMTVEDRISALQKTFAHDSRIEATAFKGLVIDFAKTKNAKFLVRGLRSSSDFDYELPMAHTNRCLAPEVQTIFFPTAADRSFISSTLVREIVKNGGDFSSFVPTAFLESLKTAK
ncbi:MAG: pantetheine-phosphate adenylyltransferase [Proteobacteria bacterium]|nr:MAG: pantetheine-phosphate adenylyltransferase [Pseudomonadota bacterium]